MLNNNEITKALPLVTKYARKLLGRVHWHAVEDLVHDTIVQAMNANTYDPAKGTLEGYLCFLVRGRVFNYKAKACNRMEHILPCLTDKPDFEAQGGEKSDTHVVIPGPDTAAPEALDQIAALASLEGQERALIEALALGHTLSEAAEIAGWSVATACRKRKEIAARIGR